MTAKATAIAPANIAFVKYWGASDLEHPVPNNPSISMTLSRCVSRTTVEHLLGAVRDEIRVIGDDGIVREASGAFLERARAHLSRLRRWADVDGAFRVVTRNSFPAAAGLASSASGFTALALATLGAIGKRVEPAILSELARLSGSGSAARSALGGFVRWPATESERGIPSAAGLPAEAIADATDWDLRDVIAVCDDKPKSVSSREGHARAASSPYYRSRLERLPERVEAVKAAIAARSLDRLGPVVEEEAIDLHLIAMSSRPPIYYWRPATLGVLEVVRDLRDDGVPAWATIDAGPNVHVLCLPEHEDRVAHAVGRVAGVESTIRDRVGVGPSLVEDHLTVDGARSDPRVAGA